MMRCIRKEITELLCYCKVVYNTVGSIIIQRVSRQYNVFDYSSCSLRAVVDSAEKKRREKARKNSALSRAQRHTRTHRSRSAVVVSSREKTNGGQKKKRFSPRNNMWTTVRDLSHQQSKCLHRPRSMPRHYF